MSENCSTTCDSSGVSVLNNSNTMSQQVNNSVSSASGSTGESSGQNPLKKQIDPLELLNCLSILLNSNGGIKSIDEVQRVAGLMGKYSKKLVSKCIYLNILQATEEPLLDEFYKETGWNLVCSWLTEAVSTKNYPLAEQILSLLLMSPVTVDRLKRNNMPKMVKDLSKDSPHTAARESAEKVVQLWKELVKGYTSEGGTSGTFTLNRDLNSVESSHSETSNTSESMKVSVTNPVPLNIVNSQVSSIIVNKKSISEEREAAPTSENSSLDVSDLEVQTAPVEKENPLSIPKLKIGRGRGSPGRGGQRGVGRGRARRKRGSSGVGRGRGKSLMSYAELLCQDINSTYGENHDKTSSRARTASGSSISSASSSSSSGNNEVKPSQKEGPVPPLRITIRNGVKVLRNDTNDAEMDIGKKKRPSVESTDSDDNKPLSILKNEHQKDSSPIPESSNENTEESNSTSEKTFVDNQKVERMEPENDKLLNRDEEDEEEEIIKKRKKGKRRIMIYGSDDDDDEEEGESEKNKSKISDEAKQAKVKRENVESDSKKKKDDSKVKIREDVSTDGTKIKDDERKRDKKISSHDKSKVKAEVDKDRDDRRDKEKEKSKDRDKERSKNKSSKDKEKERDRDKDRNRDKYKDRDKEKDRDRERKEKGDKKREKERRRDSDEKAKDNKRREQIERDKATLDKVKPLSTQGLSKIPRKTSTSLSSPKSSTTPVSFLDALGSADSELESVDNKRSSSSVIKSKSRGFRNTGLLDETIKPPGVAGKRSTEALKQKPSSSALPASSSSSVTSSTIKISPSSAPATCDRPGGVKLISPKRPILSDDGGFMAALTAAGVDRKKIVRKRKSSDSDSKSETNQKLLKTENAKESLDGSKPEEMSPKENNLQEENSLKAEEKENGILSPTSIKPTFNFYKDTLSDNSIKDEIKSESDSTAETVNAEDTLTISSKADSNEEVNSNDSKNEEENMEFEENDDDNIKEEPMEITAEGDGDNSSSSGAKEESMESSQGSDSDYLDEAPVPAPAQEDYEKVEVTFTPTKDLKGVLVYHRPQGKRKKGVKWKADADLKEIFYFPMDETERVNVNTIKFNEMMMMEKAREKELMFGKNRNRVLIDGMHIIDNGRLNNCIDYGPYKLYPVHLPNPPSITPGVKSVEKQIQAQREHATMATFFHPAMLPDSPSEPDPEMVTRVEPIIIPLKDVTGNDSICDNRVIPWPEPILNPPDFSPYMGPPSQHQGPPPPPPPPQHGGGHWVLGNHTVSRFSAGPSMFGGHPPPQGPGANPGFVPPTQGYPGDMRGGWGGPSDFSGPPVLMPNGPPPMGMPPNIGGPNMHGGPPLQGGPGPSPGMGMGGGPPPQIGNRDNYRGYRRGGGGNWGGHQGNRGLCKHFRHGKCRHGDDCKFLHVPS